MGVAVPLQEARTGEMSMITSRDRQHLFSLPHPGPGFGLQFVSHSPWPELCIWVRGGVW